MTSPHPPDAGSDPDFFDDAYYRLLEPFHTEEDARFEVAALREELEIGRDPDHAVGIMAGEIGPDQLLRDLASLLLRRARRRQDRLRDPLERFRLDVHLPHLRHVPDPTALLGDHPPVGKTPPSCSPTVCAKTPATSSENGRKAHGNAPHRQPRSRAARA